jgi:hypothetical protein
VVLAEAMPTVKYGPAILLVAPRSASVVVYLLLEK